MKTIYGIWVLLTLLVSRAGTADTSIALSACLPTERVMQKGDFAGAAAVELGAARGEYESAQVVVTAAGGKIEHVTAALTPRAGAAQDLPSDWVTQYRVAYVPLRYSAPRATCAPGLIPDPLIPFADPYTGAPVNEPQWAGDKRNGPRFGAQGFEVWPEHHQPIWLDVHVPPDAAAGVYEAALRVTAGNATPAEIPVRLEVWDFALPDGPTHETSFGGFSRAAAGHHLTPDSGAWRSIEERYIEMLAAHRISPMLPTWLQPKPGPDGAVQFDDALDGRFTEFVVRYHVTNIDVPRAPFSDVFGADHDKALAFYRSWYAYLEKKGWAARAYLYMLDEPNDAEAYEEVRRLGALVREAAPGLRRLVVEQPYTQDPAWGVLDGAVDIWCPLFGFIDENSVQRVRAAGNTVWSYTALVQKAPAYHPQYNAVKGDDPPYWQLDFPATAYRIAPWLNFRYGITGLLYWSTVYWGSPDRDPWDDPGFRVRWNNDGALFCPGYDAGVEGPIASIRLKNLRDGLEDYEYFVLLEQRGGGQVAGEIARAAVPTWGSWIQDGNRLVELRRQLASEIIGQ